MRESLRNGKGEWRRMWEDECFGRQFYLGNWVSRLFAREFSEFWEFSWEISESYWDGVKVEDFRSCGVEMGRFVEKVREEACRIVWRFLRRLLIDWKFEFLGKLYDFLA
jgi:hypothetical protein